ncbi:MAG: hypothetical protein AMJ73_06935 [candidate division Zixibacteria bacterium SM1_73]|nr:MAG: hypothetical protein AMJ73_06935 [candidate division Zixibacteria bacterium SM1_73]
MSFREKFNTALRRYFLSGILVIVPLIITILVLRFLFKGIDGLLSPYIAQLLGYKVPGLGVVATIILIFLAGFLTANVIGSRLFRIWEIFWIKTPLVRTIYGSSKRLVEALTTTEKESFKQVVLVEFPRKGMFCLGFLTRAIEVERKDTKDELVAVFIPSTPTPFSGWTMLFAKEDVVPLEMTIEEGIKFFVSGAIASPDKLNCKDISKLANQNLFDLK